MRSSTRACGALGVLALLVTGSASAQGVPVPPPNGRREVTSIDFAPNGGWRVKTRQVMATRRAALARRDFRALNSPNASNTVTGDLRVPVVFIAFADTNVTGATPVVGDTAAFRPLFFSSNPTADNPARPYSLKTYYEELSNGNLQVDGQLFGWVHTAFTWAAVGHNCAAVFAPCTATQIHNGLGAMFRAALDSLNSAHIQVDWGQFDNDGPDGLPNSGDDDGTVDFVTFIHPDLGGECGGIGGGQGGNHIWAHRWQMSAVSGSLYTTKTPRSGGGFIRINDYTVQSARGGNTACSPTSILPVGTLAHETGHTFDIPDLYANCNCAQEGVGEWSLMGSGNYTRAYSPAAWDAWSLLTVGWITADSLTTSRSVTLNPIQTSDTVLVAPVTGSQEYFIFENRAYFQSDTAQFNYVSSPPKKQPGLLVWHIDDGVINATFGSNTVNVGPIEGVHLMQADGAGDLQSGADRGDIGDSYPGSTNNHTLNYHSNPALLRNDGTAAGFVVDSIQQGSNTGPVTFRFRRASPYLVRSNAAAQGAQITVNGVSDSAYREIFALGDSIHFSVADTQLVNLNRTEFAFGSWSDGGARVHAIASDGTPDTVTATLNALHRVNFVANGSGTVGTSGPANGTYVLSGTSVTLTATPNGGQAFTNWTGDTTTGNAVLVLPMTHPYSVTANFSGAVAVSFDQATQAILGIASLTGPQATYLDSQGNNNATYDLGDYLAYLKANAIIPSPELMQRVLAATAHPLTPSKER